MSGTTDVYPIVLETDAFSLTRLEAATVIGAVVAVVGLVLPWVSGLGLSVSGFAYTWLSPAFVGGAGLAAALAVPDGYVRLRYAVIALVGVALAAIGIIMVLGIPSLGRSAGIGVFVFTLGGLLVTTGGYGSLVREMSTMKATAIVCAGSVAVLTAGLILVQVS